jgi:hypothetical protein
LGWKPLVCCNVLLFAVMWCKATESHTHLSESLMLFTLTAENAEHLVLVQWRCTHAMLLLIYSCQLSVSDNSFSDGQPCHNEHSCSFLCSLWLTSSNHPVYSTLFWSLTIEISWLTYVPRMHLTLPLSPMSATVFRSYTVSHVGCLSFACHQTTLRRC